MIRRYFLAALLLCAVSCPMMAQDGKVNVLYLDGTAHEVQSRRWRSSQWQTAT